MNLIGKTLLEQFRVDAFIAAGGMGAVYRVWDLQRNVPLAMKVLHEELAEDPSIFRRFEREARALKKLTHPNIVPFYGLYHTMDQAFLLEHYIDGATLKQILRQRNGQPLSMDQTLTYLNSISSALGYAHAHDVVHCDVKPGNVMVDRGGAIYLTDFGIARHAESTTTTLGFAGTAAYMAPEQCRAEAVTPETDVYAMGVMLYEMLTGRRPFRGDEEETEKAGTAAERVRYAHIHLPPPNPCMFNPDLPGAVVDVILKALSKKPEERYRAARALYEALYVAAGLNPELIADRAELPAAFTSAAPSIPASSSQVAAPVIAGESQLPSGLQVKPGLIVGIGVFAICLIVIFANLGGNGGRISESGSAGGFEETGAVEEQELFSTQAAQTVEAIVRTQAVQPEEVFSPTSTATIEIQIEPTHTRTRTPTPSDTGTLWRPISGCPKSRLRVGDWTRVTLYPAVCNRLRNGPSTDYSILTCVEPGGVLRVIDGPICEGGWLWWKVRTEDSSHVGWMVEGDGSEFWVEPGSIDPP